MIRNKKVVFIVLLIGCMYSAFAAEFSWKLFFKSVNSGTEEFSSASKIIVLSDSGSFSFHIVPSDQIHCYIVDEDSSGTATVVYNGVLAAGTDTYFSGDDSFPAAKKTGIEKIHIIVCYLPQKRLEQLIASVPADSAKIIDEIMAIKQNVSTVTERPVKPAVTGGTTRQFTVKRKDPYTEFNGADVYVKTIRIQH